METELIAAPPPWLWMTPSQSLKTLKIEKQLSFPATEQVYHFTTKSAAVVIKEEKGGGNNWILLVQ